MSIRKFLLLTGLVILVGYGVYTQFIASKSDGVVSQAGFIPVPWIDEAPSNTVVIIGPT